MIKSIKDYSLEIVIVILALIVLILGIGIMCASCEQEPLLDAYEVNELIRETE